MLLYQISLKYTGRVKIFTVLILYYSVKFSACRLISYKPNQQALPTLWTIIDSDDTGSDLGLKYYRFLEEFRDTYPDSIAVGSGKVSEETTRKLQLESAIYNFATFAGWALLLPP